MATHDATGDVLADRLLTPEAVAELLCVTTRYVWRLGRAGHFGDVQRVGKYVRYTEAGVRRYLESGRQVPVQVGATAATLVDVDRPELPAIRARRRERLR